MSKTEKESTTEELGSEKRLSIKKEHISPRGDRIEKFGPSVNRKRQKPKPRPRRNPRKRKEKY